MLSSPSPSIDSSNALWQWLSQGTDQPLTPAVREDLPLEEERFLRFHLNADETALLSLKSIQEVSQIPRRGVLPVPEVAPAVLGVANCRGALLWLVDLPRLLGVESSPTLPTDPSTTLRALPTVAPFLHTITITAESQSVGLVVPLVLDLESYDPRQIHPATAELVPTHLLPFLEGSLLSSGSPVLSARAVLETLQMQPI